MRGIGLGLAAARGLPHMRQDQALRRHDQRVMRIEAIERQPFAGGQRDDVSAGAAQGLQHGIIFAPRFGEVGPRMKIEVLPFGIDAGLRDEGRLGRADRHAFERAPIVEFAEIVSHVRLILN